MDKLVLHQKPPRAKRQLFEDGAPKDVQTSRQNHARCLAFHSFPSCLGHPPALRRRARDGAHPKVRAGPQQVAPRARRGQIGDVGAARRATTASHGAPIESNA